MSSKLTVCGVCEYRNITKSSVVWCSECDEGLCEECKDHHAASKGTREHSIVPISDYRKLPTNILEITQSCPKHNEKCVIFCKKHDCPCCRRCVVETHDDCKELNAIDDVIKDVKSSNAFLEMEHMLAELSENLQRIRKDRQDNIKSLKENKAGIEKEIKEIRILINVHLDNLQELLMKELYAAEERENNNISCLISSIQEKEREITECQTNLNQIKQHASDLQTFLAMKHIQQDVTNSEMFIESLLKEDNVKHVTISFKREKALENLPTAIIKMGTIILDTRPSDTRLTNRKNKQAQIMLSVTHVPSIDDINVSLEQTVKTFETDITGCSLLPDGRMMFSCFKSYKIYVIKTNGTLDFTLQTGSHISHINVIQESQKLVVTSSAKNPCIKIIDINSRKTEKSIGVGSIAIYGIVHKDGKLFYNGGRHGLCVVNLDDDSITKLVNAILSNYSSIAIWSDQLYYITSSDSVACCDLQGTLKWTLAIELAVFLTRPRGITVDNNGHVYLASYSNYVSIVSPDGNKQRVLLSEKDGLVKPQALFFDCKNNKLLIANQTNEAFLYDVSN